MAADRLCRLRRGALDSSLIIAQMFPDNEAVFPCYSGKNYRELRPDLLG